MEQQARLRYGAAIMERADKAAGLWTHFRHLCVPVCVCVCMCVCVCWGEGLCGQRLLEMRRPDLMLSSSADWMVVFHSQVYVTVSLVCLVLCVCVCVCVCVCDCDCVCALCCVPWLWGLGSIVCPPGVVVCSAGFPASCLWLRHLMLEGRGGGCTAVSGRVQASSIQSAYISAVKKLAAVVAGRTRCNGVAYTSITSAWLGVHACLCVVCGTRTAPPVCVYM